MDREIGVFVRELKNRFLCEIIVNGVSQECYVPSSSHLSNYIDLTGKEVFLRKNQTKGSRTQYALQSLLLSDGSEIPLEMALSNIIVGQELNRSLFSFLGSRNNIRRELLIDGYKCDWYVQDTKTIIEIKSILTLEKHALFPTVYSERAVQQLYQIGALLSKGYRVCYVFVSLSPRVKDVLINAEDTEYYKGFRACVDKGMVYKAFSMETMDGSSTIKKSIPLYL